MGPFIFHLVTTDYYQQFEHKSYYFPASLEAEGFVHCCFENQIPDIVARYFKGIENLLALKIEIAKLEAEVKLEMAPVGVEYPHIYGEINREAIIAKRQLKKSLG